MNRYEGVVTETFLVSFQKPRGCTLIDHAANTCEVEEVLALAAAFCPSLVEVEGCIFISEFFTWDFKELSKRFQGDRVRMERWLNAVPLSKFFPVAASSRPNDKLLAAFKRVWRFFWEKHLKDMFPEKTFIVEITEEIEGEKGLAITFYQDTNHEYSLI